MRERTDFLFASRTCHSIRMRVKRLSKMISKFLNLKLRTKFLLSFTVMILVTVLMISSVNYYVSVSVIKQNTAIFSEYLIEQIGINLEKRTKDIEEQVFQQFRNSALNTTLGIPENSEPDLYIKNRAISEFMKDLLFSKDDYLSVMVIDAAGNQFGFERSATQNYNKNLMNVDVEMIKDKRGRASWIPGNSNVIFMEKAVYDVTTNRYVGIIIVGVDSKLISGIYTNVDELTKGNIVILNEVFEPLLFERLVSKPSRYFIENKMYAHKPSLNQGFQFEGQTYISTIITTPYDKWMIVQVIAVNELTRGTEVIKVWTISTILVSMFIAFILAVIISRNITGNVRLLLQSMTHFSMDFTHKAIVPRSRDEVGLLAEKFNSMAEKIGELIHTIYTEKLLKQKAEYRTLQFEYKALQAQIDPHFLYNTLESIHSLAKLRGDEQVSEMIYLLGKLLRESISKKGDIIYLQEEVDYIRSYLTIHKIIYGHRIEVNYYFDTSLMSFMVPKFILQPLVENSIKHGIEEKPGKGIVSIGCWTKEDDLYLEVSDNGVGIDEETRNQLLNPPEHSKLKQKDKHTNVGVISVHKRIQILYGEEYGLSIMSEMDQGTTIRIRLPIITEEGSE
ncbi:HAMP domain-containing protein [Paenibacillus sp. LMG 31460]|uniref:histidine kinase n=2 Tax=Paenibacillus germinis TaxID=2654979 RepID=A0ABX1YY24_9BACL|nr:HAMP domain-containing protein [Paenibacillus germinis]